MTYSTIVNLVITIASTLFSLLTIHYVIFGLVGLIKRKKYPKTEQKLKYGIIIPARNEEKVVANLIESCKKNNYPQEKLHIFVIAHNCTDKTAQVAREAGATVYEYNNPKENTMGYAFKYLFQKIEEDFKTQSFDGFFMFNADNILDENYFDKMNDAFVAENKQNVITSFRNSKNFGSGLLSGTYGVFFASGCRFESAGRTVCGCSTRVQGTGYVISSDVVKDGWKYVTLTEDWEFSADQILSGRKIKYCDEAMFYDEQPTSLKVMLRQRLRWSKGHLLVCLTRLKDVFKQLFRRKKDGETINRFSTYDIFVNILPISIICGSISILNFILLLFAPLFQTNIAELWSTYLVSLGCNFGLAYLAFFVASILTFICERKRIKNVSLFNKICICIVWPIFMLINVLIEFVALFSKNVGWKTIPHTDTTNFDDLNNKSNKNKITNIKERKNKKKEENLPLVG